MNNLWSLTKLIKHTRRRLIVIVLISAVGTLLNIVRPYMFKLLIDQVTALSTKSISVEQFTHSIVMIASMFLVVSLIFSIIDTLTWRYSDKTSTFIYNQLLNKVFDKLSTLSTDFFESKRIGETISKINRGINTYINWLNLMTQQIIDPLLYTIAISIIFLIKIPIIGGLLLVLIAVNTIITVKTSRRALPINLKESKESEKSFGIFTESFTHISTIRSIGSFDVIAKKFRQSVNRSQEYSYQTNKIWFHSILWRDITNNIFITCVILALAINAFNHQISPGDVAFYILLIQQAMNRIYTLGRFINQSDRSNTTTGRLVEVLETKPSLPDSPDAEELLRLYSVEFKNVSFTYPNTKKDAIKNISFKIEGGKTLALVGPSGVGKSTITKLLLRFYAPTSGQILINGEDIANFTQDSIRSHLGMVMQDVALFNTTIEENIKLAKSRAKTDQVISASHQAFADEFINELPKKFQTLVGERGIKLSGGQKQRIAIARAILKNPQLIILDEATSALDSESERLVQAGLKKLMTDKSALIIAHRLSTVMHADEILVLKNGQIVEHGNHKQLIKLNKLYARLFRLQSSSGRINL